MKLHKIKIQLTQVIKIVLEEKNTQENVLSYFPQLSQDGPDQCTVYWKQVIYSE